MKMILLSTDFRVNGSVEEVEKLVGKNRKDINFAVINEAYAVENGDHKWIIESMNTIMNNFGGNIEFVNLLALDIKLVEKRIMLADVIFVLGGNTEYLKNLFEETGFSKLLPELLKAKVYIGSSAGSMIVGHLPSYKTQDKYYGQLEHYNVKNYFELLDLSILPHFRAPYLSDRDDKWAIEESKNVSYPVYALSDDSVLIINGNERYVIGENYLILKNGEKI